MSIYFDKICTNIIHAAVWDRLQNITCMLIYADGVVIGWLVYGV